MMRLFATMILAMMLAATVTATMGGIIYALPRTILSKS
jgi:hypothetical protein